MARYIDADKADVRTIHSSYMGYSSWADVLEWLQSQPTADVVELPCRCEKCKYRKTHTCAITGTKTLFCDYGEKPVVVEPTHYCSYGERRKDNG